MNFNFDINEPTPLCEIMGRNNSDKGCINIKAGWHNYTTFYYSIFKDMRDKELRIFELGIGTNNPNLPSSMGINGYPGASLYGWCEFFYNSKIFGADIDKDILFNTDRIKTFYCDQRNPTIIRDMFNNKQLKENFDIIIEDGLHELSANICFFENSIHKLKNNGYYIIEDIHHYNLDKFSKIIDEWKKIYKDCIFTIIELPSYTNNFSKYGENCDNNLLVVYKK
jgi:hypothetical protein